MELCVIASGSGGNATVVAEGETAILIDDGIPMKTLSSGLREMGLSPASLSGVLVTHSHSDHIGCLNTLSKSFRIPLFATEETAASADFAFREYTKKYGFEMEWFYISPGTSFDFGSLSITPFEVPHDANGAVAYTLESENGKIGIATDLGFVTNSVRYHLADCNAMVLEMNHDFRMLMDSQRSESLKKRISSRLGHLSNDQAVDFLESIDLSNLNFLLPAHVSEECNSHEAVLAAVGALSSKFGFKVVETFQDRPSEVVKLPFHPC